MKTIIAERPQLDRAIADRIAAVLREKPEAALALSSGRSTRGVYALLGDMCAAGELSFEKASIFAVTELIDPFGPSCAEALGEALLSRIDLPKESFYVPPLEEPESYDRLILEKGGLDLCLLGLGINGHIGYNEPATPFDSLTHRQKLTDATKRQHLARGEKLPDYALTMGIKTIVSAKRCILLATGREKAPAVYMMMYGKTDSFCPAAFLQMPWDQTVYLDREAAEKL